MDLNTIPLSEKEEMAITQAIADIIKKDNLYCLAYNICSDHVHILLVCKENELSTIVKKLKSMSARMCNIMIKKTIPSTSINKETIQDNKIPTNGKSKKTLKTQFSIWAQKYSSVCIYNKRQLFNVISYINNNRIKHKLIDNSKEIQSIINTMICKEKIQFSFCN
jgi:REP element-mobilizing transposase RayT